MSDPVALALVLAWGEALPVRVGVVVAQALAVGVLVAVGVCRPEALGEELALTVVLALGVAELVALGVLLRQGCTVRVTVRVPPASAPTPPAVRVMVESALSVAVWASVREREEEALTLPVTLGELRVLGDCEGEGV